MSAPVAIFVYNRADNMIKTLKALENNTLAKETDVYVFSDGGKDEKSWKLVGELRNILATLKTEYDARQAFKSFNIIERPENIYLERNIMEGIGYVFDRYDTLIVLEDDIVTSPYFLEYMNEAFRLYESDEKVMHVSGFSNLDLPQPEFPQFYFTPHMSGWGWGTWRKKWQKHFVYYNTEEEALAGMTAHDMEAIQYGGEFPCLKSLKKRPIPWDICWEIAIYKSRGLCLTPHHTLVRNTGLSQGTHFKSYSWLQWYEFDREPLDHPISIDYRQPSPDERIERLFKEAIHDWGIRYTWLGKIARAIYKKIHF